MKGNRKRLHLDNIDIREVLDELNIYYTEEGKNVSSGWLGVTCPFCMDSSNHLGINVNHKTINCFKCGTSGTVIRYLSEELGNFSKAIKLLEQYIPRELRSFDTDEKVNAVKVELPDEASTKMPKAHAKYLKSRGFDPKQMADKYNLHFVGPTGYWRNRIIVPVIRNYRLITFTSVDIAEESPMRYRHLKDEESVISIKHHLFGLEFTNLHTVWVVEGLFDQWRLSDGTIATFGTQVTAEQKHLLSRFAKVNIVFDGDEGGYNGANRLACDLAPFTDVHIFDLEEGKDPDKLSEKEIKLIKNYS